MKKFKLAVLVLLLAFSTLFVASCSGARENVDVTRVYVNKEMHAVAVYSDGTEKDLGYVGVEVEVLPPLYTVTFLDAEGSTLKIEKVYKGLSATPPTPPEIADKIFDGWDTDVSVITADKTVRPVYVADVSHTVTFLDETGNLLKTESVLHGRAATPPEAPVYADRVFVGWDVSFDAVKSDLTVRAVYRDKQTYTVTFLDYSGLVLGMVNVKEGENAVAPLAPTRDGYIFSGWSGTFENITANKTVTAKYKQIEEDNVFDISYTVGANGTVTLTVSLTGRVKFAGLEGTLAIPDGATDVRLSSLGETTSNIVGNAVRFVHTNATDITEDFALFKLSFASDAQSLTFDLSVEDIYDQDFALAPYTVVGETVKIK